MQQRRLGLWALTGILLVVLSGCQVQFVSRYDAPTDEGVTALQKKVSQHLVTLQGQAAPECVFTNHEAFYIDALSDVQVLLTRANAINTDGLNDLTVSQLSNTQDSLETLRNLHRDLGDTCISEDSLEDLVTLFNTAFEAILEFEIAKKREP